MPIIDETGRKHWRIRLLIAGMYLLLAIFGVTMAYPFLITLTSSTTNAMDYNRFSAFPQGLVSREERFVRGLATYFPESLRNGMEQFNLLFGGLPDRWMTWQGIGNDTTGIRTFAQRYLSQTADPARWAQVQRMAADYHAFASHYPLSDSVCAYNERQVATYFRRLYLEKVRATLPKHTSFSAREQAALALLSQRWGVQYESFYLVSPTREYQVPWDQPNYWPPADAREEDFAGMRAAYRDGVFLPGVILEKLRRSRQTPGEFADAVVPAAETRPFPLKTAWLRYLGTPETRTVLALPAGSVFTIADYNLAFGTHYSSLPATPFPVPAAAPLKLHRCWNDFVQTQYPKRLIEIAVTPAITRQYQDFIRARFRGNLQHYNELLGMRYAGWEAVTFPARMPVHSEMQSNLWIEFVGLLPVEVKHLLSAEAAYQQFLLARYGTLSAINHEYGWQLTSLQQAEMPFDIAYLVTFTHNEWPLYLNAFTENYRFVLDYLVFRGRAVANTVILILLTLLAALTINPLAAYALSRFQMRQMPAIILFLLATMAFPAAVSMIPGFLLMRDLGLLNTYAALILPGVANGMSIFLLKGFFDSLPPELYEAAALDGAKEWQVFLRITLPLSKPILAVIALNCFMSAYGSWEWALIVCQKQSMWTLAVWLYQFSTLFATSQPWAVMASFIIASLPVFLVFLFCQNIILRGIILPQMK